MATSNRGALGRFLERLLRRSRLNRNEQEAILGLRSHAFQAPAYRDIVSPGHAARMALCLEVARHQGEENEAAGDRQRSGFRLLASKRVRLHACRRGA